MSKINEQIGLWLLIPGNTKTGLARELGFSRVTLNSRLEGSTEWSWSEVCKLAEILDCPLSEFRESTLVSN